MAQACDVVYDNYARTMTMLDERAVKLYGELPNPTTEKIVGEELAKARMMTMRTALRDISNVKRRHIPRCVVSLSAENDALRELLRQTSIKYSDQVQALYGRFLHECRAIEYTFIQALQEECETYWKRALTKRIDE